MFQDWRIHDDLQWNSIQNHHHRKSSPSEADSGHHHEASKTHGKTHGKPIKTNQQKHQTRSNTIKHQSITIKDHQKQSTTNQKNNHTPSRTNGKHIKHPEIQTTTTNNAKKNSSFHQVIFLFKHQNLLQELRTPWGPQIRSPFRSFSLWQRLVGPWWLHRLGVDRNVRGIFAKVSH